MYYRYKQLQWLITFGNSPYSCIVKGRQLSNILDIVGTGDSDLCLYDVLIFLLMTVECELSVCYDTFDRSLSAVV